METVWHDHPDMAVIKRCVELEKIRVTEGQTAYWGHVGHELKTNPWFLMRVALEWGWLDEDLVGHTLIKHLADNWGEDLGVLFPRGHGKTLPFSALVIQQILRDPEIAILQLSRTDDNADKIGAFIADQLMYNDYIQNCFAKKFNQEKGFLPSKRGECQMWGKDGYSLPWRKPRLDPTLLTISLKGAKAGKHPDFVWIDDPTEKENNDEKGWQHVKDIVQGLWFLIPAHGFMLWSGTRWHDADPIGMALKGTLTGKQGPFKFIQRSCYVDDDPKKDPTYPLKCRWNMSRPSGYTHKMLEDKRKPEEQGGYGEFFDAQMRNDPIPAERSDIKIKDVNVYDPDPKTIAPFPLTEVRLMGIEVTGGGLPIYEVLKEYCDKLGIVIPLVDVFNNKSARVNKVDRMLSVIQPIIARGGLFLQQWMLGTGIESEGFGYELRRFGKAQHDDVIDAFHNVPLHLMGGQFPNSPDDPADLYISVDLAWSENKRADWTVAMAVAVDHRQNFYVLDYDRFKISSPTGICQRLVEFYQKFQKPQQRNKPRRKFPGAWR